MKIIKPSQLDKSRPGTWPVYYRLAIWIGFILVALFLYNKFVREDLLATQDANSQSLEQKENDYKRLYQFAVDLPLYEQRKVELTEKLLELLKFLPANTEMPNLIDEVYQAAYKNNINFTRFTPQPSIAKQYYNVEPISLSTSTGYKNFANFVEYIGQLDRILNVKQFDLSTQRDDPELLVISSDLETYIYNQDISKLVDMQAEQK